MSRQRFDKQARLPPSNIRKAGKLPLRGHREIRRQARRTHNARITFTTLACYSVGLALLAGSLFLILRKQGDVTGAPASDYRFVLAETQNEEESDGLKVEALGAMAAEKLVADSLNCDPGELNAHFRLEGTMPHAEAVALLEDIRNKEGDVSKLQWLGIRYIGDKAIEEVSAERTKDHVVSARLAQITSHPDGTRKVDFSSYVRKTSHPWEDILSRKVKVSVVRVKISESHYHNGVFRDDTKWHSYEFGSPDMNTVLYGYAEVGSEEEVRLRQILASDEKAQRATIEIRTDDTLLPKQYIISRVIAQDWVQDQKSMDSAGR